MSHDNVQPGTPLSTLSSWIIEGALSYFVSANEVSAAEATARQYQVHYHLVSALSLLGRACWAIMLTIAPALGSMVSR